MSSATDKQISALLQLPAEVRNQIYAFTCPCLYERDAYLNPILTRRLANPKAFYCYRCSGEAFLRVCRQTQAEFWPLFFGAHELRFQLWLEHQAALGPWFAAVSADAISHVRRFKLHTQFSDDTVDLASTPGTGSAMPGFIAVDLDASAEEAMVSSSMTWTQPLLEQPRRRALEIAKALPRVDGKLTLAKEDFLRIVDTIGWFGTRNQRERQMVAQQSKAMHLARAGSSILA